MDAKVGGVILAAGKGTRMKSATPKVLHQICGKPLIARVIDAVQMAGLQDVCVVLPPDQPAIEALVRKLPGGVRICIQTHQGGTGDALASTSQLFGFDSPAHFGDGFIAEGQNVDCEYLLVLCGDTPALSPKLIKDFVAACFAQETDLGIIAMEPDDPRGYGRVILDEQGFLDKIIEEKDTDAVTANVKICNTGIVFARTRRLFQLLEQLNSANAQGEYYLTDCFAISQQQGKKAWVYIASDYKQFAGVNDRMQLASMEEWILQEKLKFLMKQGVTFHLPATVYIDDQVSIGQDSEVWPGVVMRGKTCVGKHCQIESGVYLQDCQIKDGSVIKSGSIFKNAII